MPIRCTVLRNYFLFKLSKKKFNMKNQNFNTGLLLQHDFLRINVYMIYLPTSPHQFVRYS